MPLESQLKVKAEKKNQSILAFNLDAMDCADPCEVQVLLPASPTPKSTPHPFIKEDFNSLSSNSLLFPPSLYPIILILAPVLLHLTQC